MKVPQDSISQYIPHREPFIMIGSLVSVTADRFESEFLIEEHNMLAEDGRFTESGLLENIAQTCAASFGFLNREEAGEPKIGFIGAMTKVEVYELPPVNSTIRTIVVPLHQLGNIYLIKGESFVEGRILLGCEMKIVVTQ